MLTDMKKEPTNQDILDVLQSFAGSVDDRFAKIDKKFEQIDKRFEQIDASFEQIDSRFVQIDKRFDRIEATMVTKEYLDDKLFEVRGEIVNLGRKQDRKMEIVVSELVKRKIFDDATAHRILTV
jgi:hypothetical protein